MEDFFTAQEQWKNGELSLKDRVGVFLGKIEEKSDLNAYLEVFADEALEKAGKLDSLIDRRAAGSLAGMIIGIKDTICYAGHVCSAASKMLENYVSPYSATAVDRLVKEDAIIIGRLNCDEFAMGSSGEKSAFGPVLNPINKQYVPGGSSSGSAVAVAAGLCDLALGSDTGGSVRQPAAFCGLPGMKPTYGRISRWGLIAYGSSFDQIGIISRSVNEMALALKVMAGADDYDAICPHNEVPNYLQHLKWQGKARIAVIKGVEEWMAEEVKEAYQRSIEALLREGHELVESEFAEMELQIPVFHALAPAEASLNLGRYDGIRYGYSRQSAETFEDLIIKNRTAGFGREVKRRILSGTYVLSGDRNGRYYQKAMALRELLTDNLKKLMKEVDFVFTPTTPDVAFPFGSKNRNITEMLYEDIFLVMANLSGLPAISLPVGNSKRGLPLAMQIMANAFEEKNMLAFSEHFMHKTRRNIIFT